MICPYGDNIVDGLVQYQKRIYICARGDSLSDYSYVDYREHPIRTPNNSFLWIPRFLI